MSYTTKIEKNTNLIFTEVKRGGANVKTYELTAEQFISVIKNKDCDGTLDIGVEPILDADGEVSDFSADKFFSLPISEQLDMCCSREGEALAAHVSYKIAE